MGSMLKEFRVTEEVLGEYVGLGWNNDGLTIFLSLSGFDSDMYADKKINFW